MAIDYVYIGPTPANEPCEQVGDNYDPIKAKEECCRFIALIRQTLGEEPEGAQLVIKRESHDFGSYYEVAVKFDEYSDEGVEYAYMVEEKAPENWPPEPEPISYSI